MADQCRVEVVDGVPVRVRASGPLTDRDREALAELIRAVQAMPIPDHQADMRRCGCGHRHCIGCGEVWPCTTVTEQRRRASEDE